MNICVTKTGGGRIFLAVSLLLWGIATFFLAATAISSRRAEATAKHRADAAEKANEGFFYSGYDSGYQSAIVDAYLAKPLYMISEDSEGGVQLWKRVEIDEPNLKKIKALGGGDDGETSGKREAEDDSSRGEEGV